MSNGMTLLLSGLALGVILGGLLVFIFDKRADRANKRNQQLEIELAQLQTEQTLAKTQQQQEFENLKKELTSTFTTLAQSALSTNIETFLKLANENFDKFKTESNKDLELRHQSIKDLVGPLDEQLKHFEKSIQGLEIKREGAYSAIETNLKNLAEVQKNLQEETHRLVNALRQPKARGTWGEYQLQKVFEIVGMAEHVDYEMQLTVDSDNGKGRPDAIVNLPGGRHIVIDVKTPLDAYLSAIEAEDLPSQTKLFKNHAKQLRSHVSGLSKRAYWEKFPTYKTTDYVVMFIPGEVFYTVAIEHDPSLFEFALKNKVVLATPMTLVVLLRAVMLGWQQQKMTENSLQIIDIGNELYDRLKTYFGHVNKFAQSLSQTVKYYDQSIVSLERRLIPSTRKLEKLVSASKKESISTPPLVGTNPRTIQISETSETEQDEETKPDNTS